jgi:hypothetical protein
MATIRREKAAAIRRELTAVALCAQREDFHVYAHSLLAAVRDAIDELDACDEEGNACEIFRLIRDSLMDGGWDAYRRGDVRDMVAGFLDLLSKNEVVTAQESLVAGDELDAIGVLDLPQLLVDTNELSD